MGKDTRNYDLVEDDRWKRKGVPHRKKYPEPVICPTCHGEMIVKGRHGMDEICPTCDGDGEIYE